MFSDIDIRLFKNFPIDSNCYVITKSGFKQCIIVDPAQGDRTELFSYLDQQDLMPEFIILTHEHFDHISSVEYLRNIYQCIVVSSAWCSENISDSKKNLSLFHDQKGFSCSSAEYIIEQNNLKLDWKSESINFYLTPGHSPGGICFDISNNLFTGDTLLQTYKPVVKLPGGNKLELAESVKRILLVFDMDTVVYPGHGEIFKLSEFIFNLS